MANDSPEILVDVPLEKVTLVRGKAAMVIHFIFQNRPTDQIVAVTEKAWKQHAETYGAKSFRAMRSGKELCVIADGFPNSIAPDLKEFADKLPFPLNDSYEERETVH